MVVVVSKGRFVVMVCCEHRSTAVKTDGSGTAGYELAWAWGWERRADSEEKGLGEICWNPTK